MINNDNYLGSIIKDLRISKGMTQKELADGICSIKQLSRIEANTSSPSVILFSSFSSKLGDSLNDYVAYSDCPNGYLLKHQIDELMNLYYNWDYDTVKTRILTSSIIKETTSEYGLKQIEWLNCAMKINRNEDRSIDIEYFKRMLNVEGDIDSIFQRFIHPIEFKFLNALSCLYGFNGLTNQSIDLLIKSIENFETYHSNITDSYYVRFIQNLSKTYYKLEEYQKAISTAQKGISYCLQSNNTVFLAGLYLTSGKAHFAIGEREIGTKYLNNYINLRTISNRNTALNYKVVIEKLISEYGLSENNNNGELNKEGSL